MLRAGINVHERKAKMQTKSVDNMKFNMEKLAWRNVKITFLKSGKLSFL